jgi:hypothetical protein
MKEVQGGRKGNPMHQTPLKVGKKARRESHLSLSLGLGACRRRQCEYFFSQLPREPNNAYKKEKKKHDNNMYATSNKGPNCIA